MKIGKHPRLIRPQNENVMERTRLYVVKREAVGINNQYLALIRANFEKENRDDTLGT